MLEYWPVITVAVTIVFFSGGVYSMVRNGRNNVTREVFDAYMESLSKRLDGIEHRLYRIEDRLK